MNKRTMAVLLLAVLIVCVVPAAFAARPEAARGNAERQVLAGEDTEDTDAAVDIPNENEIAAEPDSAKRVELCVAKLKELRPNIADERASSICSNRFVMKNVGGAEKIRERVKEFNALRKSEGFGAYKAALAFKARAIDKAKLNKARMDFAKAKVGFGEAKEKLERAKLRLEGAKKLGEACNDANSTACDTAKEELREAAKEHFIQQADIIIRHLEQIKSRAESSDAISDERAAKIISWADEKIAAFNAIKAELEAAQTKEEILAAAKKLRGEWQDTKLDARAYIGHIVNSRIGGIIVKSKHLESKLDVALELMEKNGKDTSEVQPLVDDFHAKIEAAKASYEGALALFDEAALLKGNERAAKLNAAQDKMAEAKKALIDATSVLKDIFLKVRANAAAELAEASTEIEQETGDAEDADEEETADEGAEDADEEETADEGAEDADEEETADEGDGDEQSGNETA